jgi:hypothetical protein
LIGGIQEGLRRPHQLRENINPPARQPELADTASFFAAIPIRYAPVIQQGCKPSRMIAIRMGTNDNVERAQGWTHCRERACQSLARFRNLVKAATAINKNMAAAASQQERFAPNRKC